MDIKTVRKPKIGETVSIRHRSITDRRGIASLEASRQDIKLITGVYLETGKVRCSAGETWTVVPDTTGAATWMTVDDSVE